MSQKFHGTIEELKNIVNSTGIPGEWQVDRAGKHTFRSCEGSVLNWWPSKGTVQFQGKPDVKAYFEKSLQKLLTREKCLANPARTAAVNGSEPFAITRPQTTSLAGSYCVDAATLKRIKEALSESGNTIMIVNDSLYVVRETELDHFLSSVESDRGL